MVFTNAHTPLQHRHAAILLGTSRLIWNLKTSLGGWALSGENQLKTQKPQQFLKTEAIHSELVNIFAVRPLLYTLRWTRKLGFLLSSPTSPPIRFVKPRGNQSNEVDNKNRPGEHDGSGKAVGDRTLAVEDQSGRHHIVDWANHQPKADHKTFFCLRNIKTHDLGSPPKYLTHIHYKISCPRLIKTMTSRRPWPQQTWLKNGW